MIKVIKAIERSICGEEKCVSKNVEKCLVLLNESFNYFVFIFFVIVNVVMTYCVSNNCSSNQISVWDSDE